MKRTWGDARGNYEVPCTETLMRNTGNRSSPWRQVKCDYSNKIDWWSCHVISAMLAVTKKKVEGGSREVRWEGEADFQYGTPPPPLKREGAHLHLTPASSLVKSQVRNCTLKGNSKFTSVVNSFTMLLLTSFGTSYFFCRQLKWRILILISTTRLSTGMLWIISLLDNAADCSKIPV